MEKSRFTIEKSTAECYKIRHSSDTYWADITIDSNGSQGRISISSDYGSWQNYWGACGESFKRFLTGLNLDYVAGKFGCSQWFNAARTIFEFSTVITENIKDGYLNKDDGDEAFKELKSLRATDGQYEFYRKLEDCSQIMRIFDHCPVLVYSIDPSFINFWEKIWPVFIAELQNELALVTTSAH